MNVGIGGKKEMESLTRMQLIFTGLKKSFGMIKYGDRIQDKWRLFIWAILNSSPRRPSLSPYLIRLIKSLQNELSRRMIINQQGSRFCLKDSISLQMLLPEYEPYVKKNLLLNEGDTFVDVGSHIGTYAIRASKIVGSRGLVVAIEPDPENFAILTRNIALNNLQNVQAFNFAAWSQKDKLRLFFGESTTANSVSNDWGRGYVWVQAMSLDEILHGLNIAKVDFVKIDVEGAELDVLKGFTGFMEKNKPCIIVEIWEEDKTRFEEIRAFVEEKKYDMERIGPNYYLITRTK